MRLFGLLMVAVAGGLATDVALQNTNQLDVDVLGRTFTVAASWLVVLGVVVTIVAMIGLLFIGKGYSRARARRAAWRVTARERDELARALAQERAARERRDAASELNATSDVSSAERAPGASAPDRNEPSSSAFA